MSAPRLANVSSGTPKIPTERHLSPRANACSSRCGPRRRRACGKSRFVRPHRAFWFLRYDSQAIPSPSPSSRRCRLRPAGSARGIRPAARPKPSVGPEMQPDCRRYDSRTAAVLGRESACRGKFKRGMGWHRAADEKRLRGRWAPQREHLQQDLSRTASKKRSLQE